MVKQRDPKGVSAGLKEADRWSEPSGLRVAIDKGETFQFPPLPLPVPLNPDCCPVARKLSPGLEGLRALSIGAVVSVSYLDLTTSPGLGITESTWMLVPSPIFLLHKSKC